MTMITFAHLSKFIQDFHYLFFISMYITKACRRVFQTSPPMALSCEPYTYPVKHLRALLFSTGRPNYIKFRFSWLLTMRRGRSPIISLERGMCTPLLMQLEFYPSNDWTLLSGWHFFRSMYMRNDKLSYSSSLLRSDFLLGIVPFQLCSMVRSIMTVKFQ